MYGSEDWAVDKKIKQRMNVEEMKMPMIREDKIRNQYIRIL